MKICSINNNNNLNQYNNKITSSNKYGYTTYPSHNSITFMANVANLNKAVFVQRNIIDRNEDLGDFVDTIFDKIYQNDNNEYEKLKALKFVEDGKIALGTSLYTNLLQPKKPMGACVVLPYDIKNDRITIKQELEPHIINGVGTGFNLSETEKPVQILNFLNNTLKEYDDKTQRPPAGIAILDINHKDVESFINTKRNVDFNDWRFNISVIASDKFMDKVTNNEDVELNNGDKVQARKIYSCLLNSMHYCGEPGIIFKDKVESTNPLPNHRYKGMASCAEIGLENGEMCLFSHINLSSFVDKKNKKIDYKEMGEAASSLTRLLDNVIDINISEKVGKDNIASQKRRCGIGVCGYADMLAEMNIPYGSPQAQKVLSDCLEVINYNSKKTSMKLSKERGKFPLFDESRYNEKNFLIKHNQGSPIKQSQWDNLYNDIQIFGLRNATTTALPPTGSSSRIVGASYSIEPYFSLKGNKIFIEKLNELNLTKEQKRLVQEEVNNTGSCQKIEILPQKFKDIFKLGNEIDYKKHLKIVGTAQKFVDDGISKTINLKNESTISDVDKAIRMAHDMELKGVAIFRDGCLEERNTAKTLPD